MKNTITVLFVCYLFLLNVFSASLVWDYNSEPDVAGYRIYYGSQSRTYTNVVDVGNTNGWKIPLLQLSNVYFFAVTAYSSNALESDFSDEVSWTETNSPPVTNSAPSKVTGVQVIDAKIN